MLLLAALQPSSYGAELALETVRHSVETNVVVIFSHSQCHRSERTKAYFEDLGVPYFSLELDTRADGAELKKALSELTGSRFVPSVFVNGQHVGGSAETERAYRTGELEHWVSSERVRAQG
ncbi:hypothetical protein AB1Y20_006455 [Prymnesium parvum]|uniref:Glutaredoxin domain-containing protein n=1 Tax=Prymnesium parvum TaxID=97485 RepID=A0AB34IXI9_PRYPA|mmetsp:Transcript_39921/g.98851  ORF Transcript_39921/g.98851 Transcript_39921/m.98851 type:complete len:121 (+) Transcript_39921:99-461(+)